MRRYLDDWLVHSSSREALLRDLRVILDLCRELGIVVNPAKSNLVPSQVVQYLGVIINTQSIVASPSPDRVSRLLSTAGEFQSSAAPPASVWLSLLGMLSSLAHLVPGRRLRMRSLQICLHQSWDQLDQSTPVAWSPDCLQDLRWWLHLPRLSQGGCLRLVSPDLDFWSDASDVGWGAHLGPLVTSGLWEESESHLPINARELLVVCRGLLHFQSSLLGKTVAVFCDNVTAVAYLRKAGGTRSPFLNSIAQGILRWSESLAIRLAPQFILGSNYVLAGALSCPHQLPHSEWSLNMMVFLSLSRQWPVQIDFFATSANHRLFELFLSLPRPSVSEHGRLSPILGRSSGVCFSSVFHHSQDSSQTPGVSGDGAHANGSALASVALVSGPPPAVAGPSCGPPRPSRPPAPASVSSPLPGSPQATASCLETHRRFTRAAGFSSEVAAQASLVRRPSSRANYQLKWTVYWSRCRSHGHSVSCPILSKVADFLCWLRSARGLSVSSIRGYRSMLSAVFRFHLPSLSSDSVLHDLLWSFRLSSAECLLRPPEWNLSVVLRFFNSRRSSLFLGLRFALCCRRRCFCWLSLRPNELVSYRLFPVLLPLWV